MSNLGSTFGTAIAGTVLVALVAEGKRAYGYAMIVLAVAAVAGLVASLFLPRHFEAVGADPKAA